MTGESSFAFRDGRLSALLELPEGAEWLYVLAHGAGAGMRHQFLEHIAQALAARRIGTFRYQFPYMEQGRHRTDPPALAHEAVRVAVQAAQARAQGVPIIAGGKSYGGRMTSETQAKEPIEGLRGIVFLGFPLHAPKKPTSHRAEHLDRVQVPMLLIQGTRDDLADLTLLRPVCESLGSRATLHIVEGGDHSFRTPKRVGRTEAETTGGIADAIASWSERL
jgi:predicted alpha/beta-hydrolase family hydrolase